MILYQKSSPGHVVLLLVQSLDDLPEMSIPVHPLTVTDQTLHWLSTQRDPAVKLPSSVIDSKELKDGTTRELLLD